MSEAIGRLIDYAKQVGEPGIMHDHTTVPPMTDRQRLLQEAIDTITMDRNEEYGGPEDSFKLIAAFWNVYIDAKRSGTGVVPSLTSGDVALMMDLLKTARLIANPKHIDSVRDKAGYLGCYADVMKIYEG